MRWEKDELRDVIAMTLIKVEGTEELVNHDMPYKLPAAYHRVVSQLGLEIQYGEMNDNHEARRRMAYAREVLDAFGRELEQLKDTTPPAMKAFRSAVLTPILQRQLWGVPDAYTPFVRSAIKGKKHAELTIKTATEFYLKRDPTNPSNIPIYRRNLLYIPEARWHLQRLMGRSPSPQHRDQVEDDHDLIMVALREGYKGLDNRSFPLLTQAEASAIAEEGLEEFFEVEIANLVKHIIPFVPLCLLTISIIYHPELVSNSRNIGYSAAILTNTTLATGVTRRNHRLQHSFPYPYYMMICNYAHPPLFQ
jgi:hypothetical protein